MSVTCTGFRHRGKKQVHYATSPQSLIIQLHIRCLNIFGDFYWIFIALFIKLSVLIFKPLIVINRRGDWFCESSWGIFINLSAIVFISLAFFHAWPIKLLCHFCNTFFVLTQFFLKAKLLYNKCPYSCVYVRPSGTDSFFRSFRHVRFGISILNFEWWFLQ